MRAQCMLSEQGHIKPDCNLLCMQGMTSATTHCSEYIVSMSPRFQTGLPPEGNLCQQHGMSTLHYRLNHWELSSCASCNLNSHAILSDTEVHTSDQVCMQCTAARLYVQTPTLHRAGQLAGLNSINLAYSTPYLPLSA